jgi:hypothetical protein
LVEAASIGLSYSDYLAMDRKEILLYARGYYLKNVEVRIWERFLTAVLLQPHSKRTISPRSIIEFAEEKDKSNDAWAKMTNKERLAYMDEVHKKWDLLDGTK